MSITPNEIIFPGVFVINNSSSVVLESSALRQRKTFVKKTIQGISDVCEQYIVDLY